VSVHVRKFVDTFLKENQFDVEEDRS